MFAPPTRTQAHARALTEVKTDRNLCARVTLRARCVQRPRNDGLRFLEFHIFVACVAGVSHVSQDCHRDVARLSRSVTRCRRCVARCHRDVTAKSHICHTLSQAVATTVTPVTPCHRVSIHLSTCKQVDISPLRRGVLGLVWDRRRALDGFHGLPAPLKRRSRGAGNWIYSKRNVCAILHGLQDS